MAALHLAIATVASAGDHVVASSSLYGGTINLLTQTLPRFGIRTTLVKPRDHAGFKAAIEPRTRLVIGETIGNPGLEVLDIPTVADIAHDAGVPLLIDNTFATPYLSRPIEQGADIVMHSLTKWMGGHGLVIGGVLVDGGRFDWIASGRHATMIEPYAGYHGLVFAEHFGPSAFIMRARTEGLRDFGACLSPHNAARLLTGVETLSLRMQRHVENTAAVLAALSANEAVTWVTHPSLASHPDRELAARLLPRGAGSIVSFGVRGGRPAGRKFIEALKLASHLANVGDAKTLVIHPASTTHQQMSAEQLAAAGVGEDMVRLSVGLEAAEDIIADLGQALRASQRNEKGRS
jgi:O-acetylhomoserine (thiol)-lyase